MSALRIVLLTALAWLPMHAIARTDCSQPAQVCATATADALALIDAGQPAVILADANDFAGVLRAAGDLRTDLSAVAGHEAVLSTESMLQQPSTAVAILIGTLGRSPRIDRIVREHNLDLRGVNGRWEGYLLQVVEHPEPGIERALLIAGNDQRGTIFGIYELSRRIGVSPWVFWADAPVPQRQALYIAPGRLVDAPVVRYRGLFLNDEDPALGGWMKATYGGPNHRFYARVFELILRLKGNFIWPAMWGRAFADDDPQNLTLADNYGLVIGTSHHEPMTRAHVEWARYGQGGAWDYARNADALRKFWRAGIERMGSHEQLVTIGMRGDGDEPMSQGTAINLLETIVTDQRKILREVSGKPAEQIPQVWALYKEVQDYFDAGMQVPDDVTLLFSDDNWGNLRRLPRPGERRRGGYGVYYHFDYVGGPRNYKWLNTVQVERVWEQLQLARAHGADRLWIANVGDLKPMELPISLFLDLAWNPDAFPLERLRTYPATWAAQQFGPAHAAGIGELLTRYTQFNARLKPELITPDTWSLLHFDEAGRVLTDWEALSARVLQLGAALPARFRDAYYQLVEYPVLASANFNALQIAVARNRLYAQQGRAAANHWADEARRLFARDAELARVYEQDIAGGKWIHMMAQARIGYTHWQQPPRNVLPALSMVDVPEAGVMGVAVEGDPRGWPVLAEVARVSAMDPDGKPSRTLTVFNRGSAPFQFTARASQPWLRVSTGQAQVSDELALRIEVDWARVPADATSAHVDLRGSDATEVRVEVPVLQPIRRQRSGFIEADGVVAIEAAHCTAVSKVSGLLWQQLPNLGRTDSAMTLSPTTGAALATNEAGGAWLDCPLDLATAGEVEVRVVLSPTLDFRGGEGLRYAVSLGDASPEPVQMRINPTPGHADFQAWERAVSDSVFVGRSQHQAKAGAQSLRLWVVDPGTVFQRVEVVRGALPHSQLGPPQSARR